MSTVGRITFGPERTSDLTRDMRVVERAATRPIRDPRLLGTSRPPIAEALAQIGLASDLHEGRDCIPEMRAHFAQQARDVAAAALALAENIDRNWQEGR